MYRISFDAVGGAEEVVAGVGWVSPLVANVVLLAVNTNTAGSREAQHNGHYNIGIFYNCENPCD